MGFWGATVLACLGLQLHLMDETAVPQFLDVPALLESSQPRARAGWLVYVLVAFGFLFLTAFMSQPTTQAREAVGILAGIAVFVLMGVMLVFSKIAVRGLRAERDTIEGIGELLQLRCWPQAALTLQQVLSQPLRTAYLRAQALVYLSVVLARYHRFEDAIAVHNQILDEDLLDDGALASLLLSRAMAMLREDHLFDADRAISELRRTEGAAGSGALALVEIYRDVKTGHPDDALKTFEQKLPAMREQLGHRVGDAYGLAARAFDLLNRPTEAADAWRRATLMGPVGEMLRRYPELEKLVGRYQNAAAPAELA